MTATTSKVGPRVRIVGKDRDRLQKQVVAKYRKGQSIRAIAAELDRSYGWVHRMLSEAGVKLRGRGGSARKRKA